MSNPDARIYYPGSRLGIFGGGQLGRMFAHAAQKLGYQVVVILAGTELPSISSCSRNNPSGLRRPSSSS